MVKENGNSGKDAASIGRSLLEKNDPILKTLEITAGNFEKYKPENQTPESC